MNSPQVDVNNKNFNKFSTHFVKPLDKGKLIYLSNMYGLDFKEISQIYYLFRKLDSDNDGMVSEK